MATPTTSGLVVQNVFGDNAVDWENDAFKMVLYGPSWDPTIANGLAYSATNEVSGTGYTAGGKDVTLITDFSDGFLATLSGNVVWSSSAINNAAFAALRDVTASDLLLAIWVLSSTWSNNNGNFTLDLGDTPSANTICHIPGAS